MKNILWSLPLLLILFFGLSGCTKEDNPQDALQAYLADWQQLNYSSMHDRLSNTSRTAIAKEDFSKRYQTIYEGIGAKELTVTGVFPTESPKPDKKATEMTYSYHVKMNTVAGPVEFDHQAKVTKVKVEKKTKWEVEWNPSMIFPQLAEGDKVRVQETKAERGEIKDRNGIGLATNGTGIQIGLVPGKLGAAADQTKAKMAEMLSTTTDDINKKLGASWVKPDLFVPIGFIPENALQTYLALPGADYQKKKLRVYPYGEAMAHLTGYIGEINAEELQKKKDKGYATGDLLGKAGLEQIFEERLKGKTGERVYIVDSAGKEKATLAKIDPAAGETIKLTIDAGLQQTVYDQVKQESGSVAATDPATGNILALVSSPSYDPNAFVRGITNQQYNQWNNDPRKPFLNRFTRDYSPGSAFKLITAAIGLDTKKLDPAAEMKVKGLTWKKDASWGSYYVTRVHSADSVNLQKALTFSDNIYFAQAALNIGKDSFTEQAKKFGIGEALPLPYPFDTTQLSNKGINGEIQLADSGYGQAEVSMTSLHLALVYSALVNNGNIMTPVLTVEKDAKPSQVWKDKAITPETAELLRNDLVQAVSDPGGVGHGAAVIGMSIAGKTGTAELKQSKNEDGKENGWFVGFNAADPKLVIAMMIEDVKGRGGSGLVTAKIKSIFQKTQT